MKKRTYLVANLEAVWPIAVEDMGICQEELDAKVIETTDEGVLVEVTPNVDPLSQGRKLIEMILIETQAGGAIERRVRENIVEFNVEAGDFNGVLIGRNSKHLQALQTLVSSIINNYYEPDEQMIVKVDVGGYRARHERRLERMAVDLGKQVEATQSEIRLDSLNSYERKIIHDKLASWEHIITHSEGKEPNRVLIIEYKE